jgi:hypothetical protein
VSAERTSEQSALERFERDTAEHEMTVLRDDGVYRHLRFQRPGDSAYWYDLITWPYRLVVCGDVGDYMFSRTTDMFEFFAGSGAESGGINPHYWGEKLRSHEHGRRGAMSYSEDAFRARVVEWWQERAGEIVDHEAFDDHRFAASEEWIASTWLASPYVDPPGQRWPQEPDELLDQLEQAAGLRIALDEQVLADEYGDVGTYYEEGARQLLGDFEHGDFRFYDTWEWNLHDYDWSYLWSCWAIVRGIERYRAAAPAPAPVETREGGERDAG